jgi:hypothetical protein
LWSSSSHHFLDLFFYFDHPRSITSTGSKGDSDLAAAQAKTLHTICKIQQSLHITDTHLQKVKESSKYFDETQKKMDEKMDTICNLLQTWTFGSEMGSGERSQRIPPSALPPPGAYVLTADNLAILKNQEA